MKYICNLVNTEDNKRKNDAKINKLEVNIADDIDTSDACRTCCCI